MAAFIPSRRDAEVNERALAKVREDKEREAGDGFDGSWVAHPDLVPVCREVFDGVLGDRPNQLDRQRDDVQVTPGQLLDVARDRRGAPPRPGCAATSTSAMRYLAAWLGGNGAVGIHNLMEDAATAEISRSQIWQWMHNERPAGHRRDRHRGPGAPDRRRGARRPAAGDRLRGLRRRTLRGGARLFEQVALADDFVDFLTLPAYETVLASE